jgi:hypothetical protein
MRTLISAVAVFAFAGALLAESPFAGTWKLDSAKTKYTTGEPPKNQTLVIEEEGDTFKVAITGTNPDGSALAFKYTLPEKGGDGQVQNGPYDAVSSKRISANVRVNSYKKGGKQMSSRRVVVSKDGKILTSSVKGINAIGTPVAGTDVYEKQ